MACDVCEGTGGLKLASAIDLTNELSSSAGKYSESTRGCVAGAHAGRPELGRLDIYIYIYI